MKILKNKLLKILQKKISIFICKILWLGMSLISIKISVTAPKKTSFKNPSAPNRTSRKTYRTPQNSAAEPAAPFTTQFSTFPRSPNSLHPLATVPSKKPSSAPNPLTTPKGVKTLRTPIGLHLRSTSISITQGSLMTMT